MLFDLSSLYDVTSFVPETSLLDGKQSPSCRVCNEDCFLLDSRNDYVPVAFRGTQPIQNVNFFSQISLPDSEYTFLLSALKTHSRVILNSPGGPLFMFGEFLPSTGLLLVIRPRLPDRFTPTLLHVLSTVSETEILLSPSLSALTANASPTDEILCDRIREQFFYLDSFCDPHPFSEGLFTGSLRIANFAGCRLECGDLPFDERSLSPAAQEHLAAFLLCVLLSLRQRVDRIRAELSPDFDPLLRYRILANSDGTAPSDADASKEPSVSLPFLSCECFRNFHLSVSDQFLRIDAPLSPEYDLVNSTESPHRFHSFIFEIA